MMQCLASIQPGFAQIVAVDLDFRLFQRTWCIAELHKASVLGLSQFLRLPCEQSLKDRTHELKNLRVESMQASRPEDRRMILDKIPDKAAFDAHMQNLFFSSEGLIRNWFYGRAMFDLMGQVASQGQLRQDMRSTSTLAGTLA